MSCCSVLGQRSSQSYESLVSSCGAQHNYGLRSTISKISILVRLELYLD
jgi:hypothetical protein